MKNIEIIIVLIIKSVKKKIFSSIDFLLKTRLKRGPIFQQHTITNLSNTLYLTYEASLTNKRKRKAS